MLPLLTTYVLVSTLKRDWVVAKKSSPPYATSQPDGKAPSIFQTKNINRIHRLKYLRSTTLGQKDIGIWKSEFVAKSQFLCVWHLFRVFT